MASVLRASFAMRALFSRPTFCCIKKSILYNSTVTAADTANQTNDTIVDSILHNSNTSRRIGRILAQFEERCQRNDMVLKKDFTRTVEMFKNAIETDNANDVPDISLYSAMLLRCCGKLMFDTAPEKREALAGQLWDIMKQKKLPLDTSHYNSLIRSLNENMSKFDPQSILDEMKAAKLNPDMITYQRMIQQYSLQGNIEGAIQLLETMKDLGFELNETIFASLITAYGKQEVPPPISEMFDLMRSNNVEPSGKSYAAAFISLGERFDKDPKAIEEFTKLFELYERDEVQFSLNEIIDLIVHLSRHRETNETIDKLLSESTSLQFSGMSSRYRILSTLIRVDRVDEASKLFWSQKVSDRALQGGNIGNYWIKALVVHKNVPAERVLKECEELFEKGYNFKPFHALYHLAAENGRLELVRVALRKIVEEEPMKVHYTWPLIAQAKDESYIVDVLKTELNPFMDQGDLIETFSQWVWPKFADKVQRLFEINKEQLNYDVNMLIASFLNYSVQEGKVEDAVKFISEAPQDLLDIAVKNLSDSSNTNDADENIDAEVTINPRMAPRQDRSKDDLVSRLLRQIAEHTKDPELVKKTFNMCQLSNQQATTRSLAALVKVYLFNDDIQGAMNEFFRITEEYRVAPCRYELMQHCLENKKPEELQKIMNVTTKLTGEQNALFDLAVCCLKCNKLKQAQKIFASPGFRVNPERVYAICRSLARQNVVTVLENFVNLARDMYDVNQEILYQILLNTYERSSNAKRALHLWNMMQEEDFQPSKRSLTMIADILEKNNIEVPFRRPRV